MEGESVANVLQIDEPRNFSIRIAGDVDNRPVPFRRFGQAMDRHNGKELPERPMVEE